MQGAGNDFVVLNFVDNPVELTNEQFAHIADRRYGVGCDQILIVEKSTDPISNKEIVTVKTQNSLMQLNVNDDSSVTVDMGYVSYTPESVPFIAEQAQDMYFIRKPRSLS